MKKYAILKNTTKAINFGVVVKSAGTTTFYGWSDKGVEWANWANENNAGLKDLPIDVSVGEFKNLSDDMFNKIVISTTDVMAITGGVIKSDTNHVLIESEKIPNASRFPTVTSIGLPSHPSQKRVSVAYKVKHFRQSVAKSEIAFKVRNNELAFNNNTKQFNPKPNRASQLAERHNIRSKISRGAERQFGERVIATINKQIFAHEKAMIVKRDVVGPKTKEIVDFFAKGKLGYTIGRGARGAMRGLTPNRRTRGLASRVIEGVLDPRKRRDVDGDGLIFDGTWREMPDPTRFIEKPNGPYPLGVGPDAWNGENTRRRQREGERLSRELREFGRRVSEEARRQGYRGIPSSTAAQPDDPQNPPRAAVARLMRMDTKNSSLAKSITYDPQNGDLNVTYNDGRTVTFKDVIYERARKAGFDDKPDDLIRELEREQGKPESNPIGRLTSKVPAKKPKIVSRTSFVDKNRDGKLKSTTEKLSLSDAMDIMGDLESPSVPVDSTRDFNSAFEKIWPKGGDEWGDLISSVTAKLRTGIGSEEFKKDPDAYIKKLVNGTATDIGTRSGSRYDTASLGKLAEFISGMNSGKDVDATEVIASFDPKSPKANRAHALEAAMAYGLGKFRDDPRARARYQGNRGRKARLGSVIDDILGAAEGANEPDLEKSLNKVKKGMSLSPKEASDLIPTLEDIAKNNPDFDNDDRVRDLINEVRAMKRGGARSSTDKYDGVINDLQQAAEGTNEPQFVNALKKLESGKSLSDNEMASLLESLKDVAKNNDDFDGDSRLNDLIDDLKFRRREKMDKRRVEPDGLASRTGDGWTADRNGREWEFDGSDNYKYIIEQDDDGKFGVRSEQSLPSFDGEPNWKDRDYPETFDSLEEAKRFVGRLDANNEESASERPLFNFNSRKNIRAALSRGGLSSSTGITPKLASWKPAHENIPGVKPGIGGPDLSGVDFESLTDDELKTLVQLFNQINNRPFGTPGLVDSFWKNRNSNYLSDIKRQLRKRGYKVELGKTREPKFLGDYASGDRNWRVYKPGEADVFKNGDDDDEVDLSDAIAELLKQTRKRGGGLRSSTNGGDDGSDLEDAISAITKARRGEKLTPEEKDKALNALRMLREPSKGIGEDERIEILDLENSITKGISSSTDGGSDMEDAINAIEKVNRGEKLTSEEKEKALRALKLVRSPEKNINEDDRLTIMVLEDKVRTAGMSSRTGGLKSNTDDSDMEDAIKAIGKVRRGEKLTPDEKKKALNALKLARSPEKNLDEDDRIEIMDLEETVRSAGLASRTTGKSTRRPIEQSLTQRMTTATTERAARPRGLSSTTTVPDARTPAPKADAPETPKKKRRSRLIIDMMDNFGKTKGDGDGVLWDSMNDEQKNKTKDAIAAQKKVITERLKTKVFKAWWAKAEEGSDKETLRAVKRRARGEAGGTYKGRPADDPLTKDDVQDLIVVLDDAVRKGKINKYKLNDDGTVKTDKNGQPIMTEAYSRAARDLDDLLTILNMEEADDFSNLEHFHTGTRAAIHKNVGTTATGRFKMGDSSIAGQAGGMEKAKSVEELGDEELGKAKKLSIGRRLLRVNEKRAQKARQRALRRTGSFRRGRIIRAGDPELEMKRARLRARAMKRTMLSKFRKSRNADELSADMSKTKASLSPVVIDNAGKVTITPRYVSILAKLDDDLAKAKGSEESGRAVYDQVLADVWINSGFSGEPVLVTEDEVRRLVSAGWQPIIRGTGSETVLSESYVEQFLTDESEQRFIPGQGARAFGVGEYFAFPGTNWTGYRGTGNDRHTMLVLIPPSADVVTVGELTRERDKMRDLAGRAVEATKALGGRDAADALTPGELAENYRKALPNLENETSRSGQIVKQLVDRLEELDKAPASEDVNKEKKEILRAFDYLSRFTRQKDVGYFAPLIGVDGIDTNDSGGTSSPFLLHNRANVAAFQRPMTSEEAENMAKGEGGAPVGSVWRTWKTRPDRSREGSPIEERKRVLVGGRRRRVSTRRPDSDGGDAGAPADSGTPNPPTPKATIATSKSAVNTDNWTRSNPPTIGSNPATMLTDPNGTKYYAKLKKNGESVTEAQERMETEVLAGKLYELAGTPVADLQMGTNNGEPVMLSRMIQTRMPNTPSDKQAARSHFVVDAWLANWDAPLNDNIKIDNNGRAVRLDVGGSLDYRARGQKKGSGGSVAFGNSVGEMTSLQKSGNVDFTNMDRGELKKQAQKLGTVTDDQIRKTVSSIVTDPARAKVLADTLIARRDDIIKRYG